MPESLLSASYNIKWVLDFNQFIDVYVGEKVDAEVTIPVLINEIHERELINKCIIGFSSIDKSKSSDFIEFFSENSKLYAVFSYIKGKNLKKYIISENLNIKYRIMLLKNILHYFTEYYYYPAFIRASMMNYENIVICDNSVHFNFRLFCTEKDEDYSESGVYIKIGELLNVLFSNSEIKSEKKLVIIAEKCSKNIYQSVAEVIKDIDDVVGTIDKEKTLKSIMLEKKKKMKKFIEKVIIVCMLITAVYMVYEYYLEQTSQAFLYSNKNSFGRVDLTDGNISEKAENTLIQVKERVSNVDETMSLNEITDNNGVSQQLRMLENNEEIQQSNISDNSGIVQQPNTGSNEGVQQSDTSGNNGIVQQQENSMSLNDLDSNVEEYIVLKNDNLYNICMNKYKTVRYLNIVASYNNLKNKDLLYEGQLLKLPSEEELEKFADENVSLNGLKENMEIESFDFENLSVNNPKNEFDGYDILLEEEDYGQTYTEN